MNETIEKCPGQFCLDNGMPVEIHVIISKVLKNMGQFAMLDPSDVPDWRSLSIYHASMKDVYVFKFGITEDLWPLETYFVPSFLSLTDMSTIADLPPATEFFSPLEQFDVEAVVGMAYVTHGGNRDLNLDSSVPIAVGTLSLTSRLPDVGGMWHGYDGTHGRYVLVVDYKDRRWMIVVNFRDIRAVAPKGNLLQ